MRYNPNLTWLEPLAAGHAGTLRTLEQMRWLVRQNYLRRETRTVLQRLFPGAQSNLVERLFLFARDQIRYRADPENLEQIMDFHHTTAAQAGDCDDKTIWLATALLACGVPVRFIVQSYDGGSWDHVYLEFYDWGAWRWVALDPTADGHTGVVANIGWRQPLPPNGREMVYEV